MPVFADLEIRNSEPYRTDVIPDTIGDRTGDETWGAVAANGSPSPGRQQRSVIS